VCPRDGVPGGGAGRRGLPARGTELARRRRAAAGLGDDARGAGRLLRLPHLHRGPFRPGAAPRAAAGRRRGNRAGGGRGTAGGAAPVAPREDGPGSSRGGGVRAAAARSPAAPRLRGRVGADGRRLPLALPARLRRAHAAGDLRGRSEGRPQRLVESGPGAEPGPLLRAAPLRAGLPAGGGGCRTAAARGRPPPSPSRCGRRGGGPRAGLEDVVGRLLPARPLPGPRAAGSRPGRGGPGRRLRKGARALALGPGGPRTGALGVPRSPPCGSPAPRPAGPADPGVAMAGGLRGADPQPLPALPRQPGSGGAEGRRGLGRGPGAVARPGRRGAAAQERRRAVPEPGAAALPRRRGGSRDRPLGALSGRWEAASLRRSPGRPPGAPRGQGPAPAPPRWRRRGGAARRPGRSEGCPP